MHEVTLVDQKGVRYSLALSPDQRYAFGGAVRSAALRPLPVPQRAETQLPVPVDPAPTGRITPEQFRGLLAGSPPALGPSLAPVTIVEFADFQCPFCSRLASTLKSEVLPDERGEVRLVYRQFPLPMHPWAETAAEMSECVGEQSAPAFWRLYDFFFSHQGELTAVNLKATAARFIRSDPAVDQSRLQACLASPSSRTHVQADIEMGRQRGVHGTPTLFINGARLTGSRGGAEIEAAIAAARRN
ncbi:MAG: DsbA family protein [Terriglobales bacterium]